MQTRHLFNLLSLATRDLGRFLDRHYLTAKAADFLHRSLRRRMSQAALAAVAGFAGARLSTQHGAGATAALAFTFGLCAWVLQIWATRILSNRLAYARSHGAFLLKDRKKNAFVHNLPRLWRRVYAAEIPIAFPDPAPRLELRQQLVSIERGARGNHPESRRFDFGRSLSHRRAGYALLSARAFSAAAQYELQTSHPQTTQDARLGFSLALLEDALDTTALGHNEESSFERQAAHAFLAQAREHLNAQLHLPRRLCLLVESTLRRQLQTFWRRNVALALEARAGAILHDLHQRYQTTRIDVQDLLWGDDEALLALSLAIAQDNGPHHPPVAQTLRQSAVQAARHVFSDNPATVHRIISRMHGYDLVQATLILAANDPDYALAYGSGIRPDSPRQGPCDPLEDLTAAQAPSRDYARLDQLADAARQAEADWPAACLSACGPEHTLHHILADPQASRALRLAWHGDHNALRSRVRSGHLSGGALESTLETIATAAPQATERLRTLRLSRELAAWNLAYTTSYVTTLCGFDAP